MFFSYEAPASNVIKYEAKVSSENFVNKGPYMSGEDGLPTDATDILWEDLYQCTTPPFQDSAILSVKAVLIDF